MYESRMQKPLSVSEFTKRILTHVTGAVILLGISLAIGVLGYMKFENLSMLDAFLNSAMLLGGMGPVNVPITPAGKLFAGGYALYAGLIFVVSAALIFTPIVHRVLHKFHWDSEV